MASTYDDAMRIVCETVQSQMMWPSRVMLAEDLRRALSALDGPASGARTDALNSSVQSTGAFPPEHVIEIDEDGKVSEFVQGPIRDAGPYLDRRCEGRYPAPMKRDEPFQVTYRCMLQSGHIGPCGNGQSE